MATYNQIDQWVRKNFGYGVKTCWIADIKERCGLSVRKAPNRLNRKRLNPCPPDKIKSIKAALKYFGMI
jgi:hypothetical protein